MKVRYAILALLFAAAGAFQVRAIRERFPQWFGRHQPPAWPFLIEADPAAPEFLIRFLTPDAMQAGLHTGDTLVSIEGKPVTGSAVFGRVIGQLPAGNMIRVVVRSHGKTIPATLMLTMANQQLIGPVSVIGAAIISSFCLLLGFWVAAIRPWDRLAWLVLAFLLGFTTFFNPFLEGWGPVTRDLGAVYQGVFNGTWGIWLLLFAINFPEPLPASSRIRKVWTWFAWVIIVPAAVRTLAGVIISVGELENYAAVFPVVRALRPFALLFTLASYGASAGFLLCLAAKWWLLPASPDARRRLRVLFAAALFSYPLLLVCGLIARVRHSRIEELFPPWLYNTAYLLEFFFPLAVTYVIVVQRAMDVRLILRQSLQYALARRGVLVLQFLLSAVFFIILAKLVTAHSMSYGSTVFLMSAGIWGIFLLNGVTHWLAKWIDRRFFREVYDAEQILSDLAREVRMMVQTEPLLARVTRRISEALHVPRIAVLLDGDGRYAPAYVHGFEDGLRASFGGEAAVVREMKIEKEPLRVYLKDREGWVNRADVDPAERNTLRELDPEILLPLLAQEDLIGFMALGPKRSEAPYSGSDLRLLSSVAAQTSMALQVARLTASISHDAAQREGLRRELEIARDVQAKLFPQQLPEVQGLDYAAECKPALEVGGDYYDFLELADGSFAIAIGDVSGKGIGAALMMANLQAAWRGLVTSARDFPAMMTRLNQMVYQASSANTYATFFFAVFDGRARRLRYLNAGHNPPIVLRKRDHGQRCALRLETGGPVIGLLREVAYEEGTCDLEAGDMLVFFTDGINESMNAADEEWGEERLIACAQECDALAARAALDKLMGAAINFAAGAPQHDDMTLVVARVEVEARG